DGNLCAVGQASSIATNVSRMAQVSSGAVCYLQGSNLYEIGLSSPVSVNVADMAQDSNGTVDVLTNTGGLYRIVGDPGTFAIIEVLATSGVQALAQGNDGDAYCLQNGSLINCTTGADVHDNVPRMAQGPNGEIFVNLHDGLRLYNPATSSYADY